MSTLDILKQALRGNLSQLLDPLFISRPHVSVLEIGPGPKSVLRSLPRSLRRKINRYAAYEPNSFSASMLEKWVCSASETNTCNTAPFPCLERPAEIHPVPFTLETNMGKSAELDIVLFCHSMYGLYPKASYIKHALHFNGLVCHRAATFPTGTVHVPYDDKILDSFAPFIAGVALQEALRVKWRETCRALGHEDHPHLLFSVPEVMVAFTRHAACLPELTAQVPVIKGKTVKNREAQHRYPAAIVRPDTIQHVQQCVRWALKHGVSLTVIGGGHSGQCLMSHIVSVDMSAFDRINLVTDSDPDVPLVVVEAGCKTGDIIRKTMHAGLTVPLGARPSVGAGLWLQGGIGHLARLHGHACDSIVGAVLVSVKTSQILCIGHVPSQHQPAGATRPENEADLLWAMKGAGTNFGIVLSVTFRAYVAPTFLAQHWAGPLTDTIQARLKFRSFDDLIAMWLPRDRSADAYVYWDEGQLQFGATTYTSFTPLLTCTSSPDLIRLELEPTTPPNVVDSVELFDSEMYISGMHDIGSPAIADILVTAMKKRPSPLSYLHLLHGGGKVTDVAPDATAFGCRDWDFACVITGVWPRDRGGTELARAAVDWVYSITETLLPCCTGVYGADLGPDPRDAALAAKAFGLNRPRLARLKQISDPRDILAHACPLPKTQLEPRLIVLVTGASCAGKDYCAGIWSTQIPRTARAVSISDVTKKEYAASTGADLTRLLQDRAYKEQHRPALTSFFEDQVRRRPRLPEEHFLAVVYGAHDVDVLFITGMRDEAPAVVLSHLVPDSRLIDIRVKASEGTRSVRRGHQYPTPNPNDTTNNNDYHPSFTFTNDTPGATAAKSFAETHILPLLHANLNRLATMIRPVPDFPRRGLEFRHVLNISQQPGGLALCTSLLASHFPGSWDEIHTIVSCEAGGFIFASALALRVGKPLALIRDAGKLPPPIVSALKSPSHISASISISISESESESEKKFEMERDLIPKGKGAKVVIVDDVLATGKTLCGVLTLLGEAGVQAQDISVLAVAEFPVHRGQALLRQCGFGGVRVRSLLVFGGA
ncbi:hypothetical protein BJX99DRAFT_270567 [Aspergillus californicus]